MLTTFELPEVQRFIEELKNTRSDCFEGRFCSSLDKLIACQFQVCRDLNQAIATWKFRVFRGLIEFNPEVEAILREQILETLEKAREAVMIARDREAECFEFAKLRDLDQQVLALYRHQVKWVQPRLAERPAYRKSLTPDQIAAMQSGLAGVPATGK